jgi:hypothetical protein
VTVEELVLKISGDSKGGEEAANKVGEALKSALESPQGALQRLGSMLADKLISPMGAAAIGGAALVGTIGGVGMMLFEFAEKAAKTGAELGDMSEKTGIAVEPLSLLKGAAQIAGVDFDTLGNAIFMVQKRIGDAGPAFGKGLKDLNLNFEEFKDLTPDQQLLKLSSAFRDLPPDANRASIAFELFGKQGKEMIPLLMKPMDELVGKAREMGVAWTDDGAKGAEEFEMSTNALKLALEGVEMRIGQAVLPTLTKLMTSIVGNKDTMTGLATGGQMLGQVFGFIVQVTGYLVTAFFGVLAAGTQVSSWVIDIKLLFLQAFQTVVDKLAEIPGMARVIPGLTAMQAGLRAEVTASKKEWNDNEQSIGKYIAAGGAAYDASQEVAKGLKGLGTAQADATAKTGEHGAATQKLTADQKAAKAATEALSEAHVTLSAGVKKSAEQLLAHGYTAEETFKILKDGGAVTDDAKKAIDLLGEAHKQAAEKEKQHKEAIDRITGSIDDVSTSVRDWILAYHNLGSSSADIAKALNVTEAQVKRVTDANTLYKKAIDELDKASTKFVENQKKLMEVNAKGILDNLKLQQDAEKEAGDLESHRTKDQFDYQRQLLDEWYRDQLAKVDRSKGNWIGATSAIKSDYEQKLADITKAHDEAIRQMKASENSWANIFKGTLASIPQMLQDAFTGGGGLAGAFSGIMSKLGESIGGKELTALFNKTAGSLAEHVGMGFTSTLGTLIPGIGAAVGSLMGPVISGIGKLFDSMFTTAGRDAVKTFAASFGGFDDLHAKLLTLGDAGEALWVKLTQGVGRNNPEQAKKVIDEINAALAGQDSWMQRLPGLIEKYGLTWEQAGHQAEQAHLDEIARGLIQDFADLSRAGFDVTVITDKMSGAINDYIRQAVATGTEVPAAMKPLLQKMIEMGDLTDANGNAISSLEDSGISFATTLTQGFQSIVDAIKELTKALGGVPEALDKIPDHKNIDVEFRGKRTGDWPDDGSGGDGSPVPGAATGALVTRYGLEALHMSIGGLVRFRPLRVRHGPGDADARRDRTQRGAAGPRRGCPDASWRQDHLRSRRHRRERLDVH